MKTSSSPNEASRRGSNPEKPDPVVADDDLDASVFLQIQFRRELPSLPTGNACSSELETSSMTAMPRGMATSMTTSTFLARTTNRGGASLPADTGYQFLQIRAEVHVGKIAELTELIWAKAMAWYAWRYPGARCAPVHPGDAIPARIPARDYLQAVLGPVEEFLNKDIPLRFLPDYRRVPFRQEAHHLLYRSVETLDLAVGPFQGGMESSLPSLTPAAYRSIIRAA
jgi:hypothetical protein